MRSEVFIEALRSARRTAPLGGGDHPQHRKPSDSHGGDHIVRMNEAARFERADAIDADLPVGNQPNGRRARFDDPRAP